MILLSAKPVPAGYSACGLPGAEALGGVIGGTSGIAAPAHLYLSSHAFACSLHALDWKLAGRVRKQRRLCGTGTSHALNRPLALSTLSTHSH